MQKWYQIFQRNTGLSPYVWAVFYILPFYFIFRSSSTYEIAIGSVLIVMFFICYMLSFVSKGWLVYFWTSVQMLISITMGTQFGYVYFALFLAFFIGNLQNWIGFLTMYSIHMITTLSTIYYGFLSPHNSVFLTQLPFVVVTMIAVILLPVTTYNRNKRDSLQDQLEHANKRISDLVKLEERQRIARDLHDTLGQRLSLIGLKSDLAAKLTSTNPAQAKAEMLDVRRTARIALNEVREMVTQMRGTRLKDEIFRVQQILKAANIEFTQDGNPDAIEAPPMTEHVLSMCLKEAVTNVVKHSSASHCRVSIERTPTELVLKVEDNGVGMPEEPIRPRCNGLRGMKERLEFVNGWLDIGSPPGARVVMRVPIIQRPLEKEAGT